MTIRWEWTHDQHLLWARLNRPKANILDREMVTALETGLRERVKPDTFALVLSHEGPHFSFGASVQEHVKDQVAGMLSHFHGLFRTLDALSIPLLACVKGQCLGGGFELASFCHFIFAHPEARMGQPEIQLGVFPPMGSLLLPLRLPALADRLNLTGESLSAAQIQPFGLITELSTDPELAAVHFFEKHLASLSASSLRLTTWATRWPIRQALGQTLPVLETHYLESLMNTQDANEGLDAFLAKRPVVWRHA